MPYATYAPEQDTYEVGSSVVYTCVDGYVIDGDDAITCQSSQSWSELSNVCEGTGKFNYLLIIVPQKIILIEGTL